MRKLASIQKILKIEPIDGADKIVRLEILGWGFVARKDEFKKGELCIFCEPDSIMPERPEFEFLRDRKFRIRTIKLKKTVSQGIAFPLSILPKKIKVKEGMDVTKIIGVTKYDPEIKREAVKKSRNFIIRFFMKFGWFRKLVLKRRGTASFPIFIFKTDEERIQNMPWVIEKYKNEKFFITEKIDGTSMSCFYNKGKFGICSRNLQLLTKDKKYWAVAEKYSIDKILKQKRINLCIQGEICGPSIQKNKYGFSELKFFVFNLFNIDKAEYLGHEDTSQFCLLHGLEMVPTIDTSFDMNKMGCVDDLVEYAKGKSIFKNILREGIVMRLYGDRKISFKVINNDFLLKFDK